VTRLTVGGEADSLIKAAVGLELVTIIAIQLLTVHRRNVGTEVALVIETENIGIARVHLFQLELGMRFPERSEHCGETLRRSGQFENNLLRRMRVSMERVARNAHSFLC